MSRRPSPLDNEQCRQCSSFSDYMKSTKKKINDEDGAQGKVPKSDEVIHRREDCPLDKDGLGNRTWGFLHTMAAKYPEKPSKGQQTDMKTFFNVFSQFYPCQHCAEEFRTELKIDPPKVDSQDALSQWLCQMHNKVNVKIGKDIFDCKKVNERWKDGWLDGSCDW